MISSTTTDYITDLIKEPVYQYQYQSTMILSAT